MFPFKASTLSTVSRISNGNYQVTSPKDALTYLYTTDDFA